MSRLLFGTLLLAYIVYAGAFIYLCCVDVDGTRYFILFDDAMISMRYAKNLAHGQGLVWNTGEAIEGFTNPLWTLYMALVHLFPIAQSKICLVIQISGVLIQVGSIYTVKKIAEGINGFGHLFSLFPAFLTAFYLPLNSWSLQGMEVGILTLLMLLVALNVQKILATNKTSFAVYILLFLAILIRMDAVVPCLITIFFLVAISKTNRKLEIIGGISALLFSLAPLELFRILYYHDPLPNTYYLKLSGYPLLPRIAQGAFNFWNFLLKSNPWFFAIAILGIFMSPGSTKHSYTPDPQGSSGPPVEELAGINGSPVKNFLFYLSSIVCGQIAYSIYVGGDAWEGWGSRYITQAMPLFFILFANGILSLSNLKIPNSRLASMPRLVSIIIATISVFSFNNVPGVKYLFLQDHPIAYDFNKNRLSLGIALNQILTAKAKVATTLSGILPYYIDSHCIDMLGKCDNVIAKEQMHNLEKIAPEEKSWRWFYPGHMKWDYKRSVGELAPDVVVELWASPEEAQPYLEGKYKRMLVDGFPVYLKIGSANIDWSSKLLLSLPSESDQNKLIEGSEKK